MPVEKCFAVVKRAKATGMILTVLSIHRSHEAAESFVRSANQWYGEDHPLTPLTIVSDVLFEPKDFPSIPDNKR